MANKDVVIELNNIYNMFEKTWSSETLAPLVEAISSLESSSSKKNINTNLTNLNEYANTLIETKGKSNDILIFKLKISRLAKSNDLEDTVGTAVVDNVVATNDDTD